MKHVLDIPRTAMEVFNMLPEGTLCEVIDNALYMSPSPTTNHQEILGDIFAETRAYIKSNNLGKVFMAPCDVYLDNEENVVQPDLVFIAKENIDIVAMKGIYGSPSMVIEILSTNRNYDKEKKFELYQRNAIPEYIIVDATTKETWSYLLVDGKYQLQAAQQKGQLLIQQLSLTIHF